MARPFFHGWKVVAVAFLVGLFGFGLGFYGAGVYLAVLRARHGWSTSLISSAITTYYLLGATGVLFVGDAYKRLGPRRVVLVGAAALTLGVSGLTLAREPWHLFAAFAVMSVGWAATSGAALNVIVAPWFERRRGLAISLAFNGATGGGVVVVPLLLFLISRLGFEAGVRVTVVVMLAVLLPPVVAWLHRGPAVLGLGPDGDPPAAPRAAPAGAVDARSVLRRAHFWTISVPFALGLLAQVGIITHQIAYLGPLLGPVGAGLAVSVTTAAGVMGRLALGGVVDRLDRRAVTAAVLLVQILGVAVLLAAPSRAALYGACALFGLGVGNLTTLPGLIVQREFPPERFARTVSLVVAFNQYAFAFGPALLGVLRDATGSYTVPLALCMLLEGVAAIVVLIRPSANRGAPRLRRGATSVGV